jgi:hypothetical protein
MIDDIDDATRAVIIWKFCAVFAALSFLGMASACVAIAHDAGTIKAAAARDVAEYRQKLRDVLDSRKPTVNVWIAYEDLRAAHGKIKLPGDIAK